MNAAVAEIIHLGIGIYATRPPPNRAPLQHEERVSMPTNQQPLAAYPGQTSGTLSFLQKPPARWASHRQPAGQLWNYDRTRQASYGNTT